MITVDPAVDVKVKGYLFLQHRADLKCSRNLYAWEKKRIIDFEVVLAENCHLDIPRIKINLIEN
jgi:hypothetical protein